jgi:hypothetical protein
MSKGAPVTHDRPLPRNYRMWSDWVPAVSMTREPTTAALPLFMTDHGSCFTERRLYPTTPSETGVEMITTALQLAQPTGLGTGGLRQWILDNLLPLLLLSVALLLLWLGGGKGDNAGVMRRLGGVFVALAIIGLAVSGAGVDLGTWLANLLSG